METNKKINTRIDTKQFLILKIGRLSRKINPNYYEDITPEEIEQLRKKTTTQLKEIIKNLEKRS